MKENEQNQAIRGFPRAASRATALRIARTLCPLAVVAVVGLAWAEQPHESRDQTSPGSGAVVPHEDRDGLGEDVYVPRVGSVVHTVGPDAACDYSDLASAITASGQDDVIRVMSGTYPGGYTIFSKALSIIGGFPDCTSGSPTGRTHLDRQGAGLVLDVYYPAAPDDPVRQVNLENLVIENGGGSGFNSGGVIVQGRPGRLSVNFRNVHILDNERTGVDDHGAGLRVLVQAEASGSTPFVTLDNDSWVLRNTTAGDGGGVYCESDYDTATTTVLRMGTTLVMDNQAENGGGLAVDGCTRVYLYNGGPVALFLPTGGFINNTANDEGGAIYVSGGAEAVLRAREIAGFGDDDEAFIISGNSADYGGAASVLEMGSQLRVEDAYVVNNAAATMGGAFRVSAGGRIEVTRRANTGPCEPAGSSGGVLTRPPCNVIDGNSALGGGAFSLFADSSIDVSRSIIRNNIAGNGGGAVARASNSASYSGPDTQVRIEGSLIYDNSSLALFWVSNNSRVDLSHSTVVNNSVRLAWLSASIDQHATMNVMTSIVDSDSWLHESGDGFTALNLDCVIGNLSLGGIGASAENLYRNMDPLLVDPGNDDYRLQPRSPAIDYCDNANPPQFTDLDDNLRNLEWTGPAPQLNPGAGLMDLGAYEPAFETLSTDLALQAVSPLAFIDSGQGVTLEFALTNQGSNIAFGDIGVHDAFPAGAVVNRQWSCAAPAGVTCDPDSGNGAIDTDISDLEPGQSVIFEVSADLAMPDVDQEFSYLSTVNASEFNQESNVSNNEVMFLLRTGIFYDSFESIP